MSPRGGFEEPMRQVSPHPCAVVAPAPHEEPVSGHQLWATTTPNSADRLAVPGDGQDNTGSRQTSKRSVQIVDVPEFDAEEVNSEDLRMLEEATEDEGNSATDADPEPPVIRSMSSVSAKSGRSLRIGPVRSVNSQPSRSLLQSISFQSSTSHGIDTFHEVMAACFAVSQNAVAESHERALSLLGKCMEEMKKKEKTNKELLAQLTKNQKEAEWQSEKANKDLLTQLTKPKEAEWPQELNKATSGTLYQVMPAKSLSFPERAALCAPEGDCDSSADSFSETLKPPNDEVLPAAPPSGCAPSMAMPQAEAPSQESPTPEARRNASRNHSMATSSKRGSPEGQPPAHTVRGYSSERSNDSSERDAKIARARRPSMASNSSMQSCLNQYDLLQIWTKPKKKSRKRNKMGKFNRSCSFESLGSVESMDLAGPSDANCCCNFNFPILDPNSVKRAAWDITATLLIIYDIVAIPLLLFEVQEGPFSTAMDWSTRIFWTLDLFMSFVTGTLMKNGSIEMRPARIARKYLTSWFAVDVFIVASDWIEVLWDNGSFLGFARAGKASRTFRLLRMVRLIRLARVRKLYSSMLDRLKSEQLVIIAGIINIMLVIMALGHVIACVWYGISNQDREDTWLKIHHFDQASFLFQYTTALHWSLLQFAGGTDEIVPQNTDERIYAVGVFVLTFVMAAVFVGRLTSSMTQLHMLSRKDVERFQTLRKYLAKNEISPFLSMRVIHNAQHALLETQRFMEESRVELLSIISEPLRVELHFELYAPVLAVHPFFHCFIEACPQAMKKVCHRAMSQLLVSDGDIVFMPGEVPSPPRMIIVCSGELSYTYMNGAVAYVQAGQCISEAVLWCTWTHQGMLKAAKDCRLCILDATMFFSIVETFDHDFDIRSYARKYVSCLNSGEMDVSDLPWDEGCGDLMEVIDAMSPHSETMVQTESEQERDGRRWIHRWSNPGTSSEDLPTKLPRKSSVLMVMPNYGGQAKSAWW